MVKDILITDVSAYVINLIETSLPEHIKFHNLQHTQDVVEMVKVIGQAEKVSVEDLLVLEIAAWFHDCGYCFSYQNHEDVGSFVAAHILRERNYESEIIEEVKSLIQATRIPQKPNGILQQIICDADLAHFAKKDYADYNQRLREEWGINLNKVYTDKEWLELNINFFKSHRYFTPYAQVTLESGKQANLALMMEVSR